MHYVTHELMTLSEAIFDEFYLCIKLLINWWCHVKKHLMRSLDASNDT